MARARMNSKSKPRRTRLAWRLVAVFWIMLPLLAGTEGALAAERPLLPRKDEEINRLLLQQDRLAALKLLSEMPAERRQTGLAYALLWRETRSATLGYYFTPKKIPLEAPLIPFVLEAAKWGEGGDIIRIVRLIKDSPDKRAIPVLLNFILEEGHADGYTDHDPDGGGTLRFIQTGDSWVEGAMLLHTLTDGAVGWPKQKRHSWNGTYVDTPPGCRRAMLMEWRDWWEKNSAEFLPNWRPDDIGKNEDEIGKWCEERAARYGKDAVEEYEKVFDKHISEKGDSRMYAPDGDISGFPCPPELQSPVGTSVLISKILETAGRIPAGEPAPEAREEVAKARQVHRVALVFLSASQEDRRPVSQFLLWALKNGKIRDMQAAARALGQREQDAALEALQFILKQDITPKTLREVTLSLGHTLSAEAIAPLVKILEEEDPPRTDFSLAVRSLLQIGARSTSNTKAIVAAVSPLLTGKSVNLARAALRILPQGKSNEARDAIRNALPKMPEELKPRAKRILELVWPEKPADGESTPSD